jgi:hypothetical protein
MNPKVYITPGSLNLLRSPANFEVARRQWEYSHAVNAVLMFVALVTITLSVFADKREVTMTQSTM